MTTPTSESRWFLNADAIDNDAERAPWVRYTRMPPPEYDWESIDAVSAYTPEEQALNTAVHEAGHAVVYMAAGHPITEIELHEPGDRRFGGRAHVSYGPMTGPWLDWVVTAAAGECAEVRWMRETGRWSVERAWASERLAWADRRQVDEAYQKVHGRRVTFKGDHDDWGDFAWVMDRADEALARVWDRVLTLAHHLTKHRKLTGAEAARVAGI